MKFLSLRQSPLIITAILGSLLSCAFFLLTASSSLALPIQLPDGSTSTLNVKDFQPGRIIDDYIFTDTTTMSVDDIQDFLERTIPGGQCERYKESSYSIYQPPPYTCLFEFQQNPETGANNYGLFTDDGAPAAVEDGQTAAEMIWNAAQQHRINPQTLLVILQKEQSLITDTWPWPRQFSAATGYACPDTAPCNPQSASFYRQIQGAAWQLRQYLDNLDQYWYVIGENNILYNPNRNCGHQVVNIQNKATVALYLYTPYVPNQAALDNLFGVGDACSAYGNRNFWTYFNRWFGPTISGQIAIEEDPEIEDESFVEPAEAWSFQIHSQSIYSDFTKQNYLGEFDAYVSPSQTAYVVLEVENTGAQTWTQAAGDNRVVLVPDASTEAGVLCNPTWYDCQQIAWPQEEEVATGEVATFGFEINVPAVKQQLVVQFGLNNNDTPLQGAAARIILAITDNQHSGTIFTPPAGRINPSPVKPVVTSPSPPTATPPPATPAPANNNNQVVVLPANWAQLSVAEKIRLNPWGCHDTTKIRADNGQCLSGGYTIPGSTPAPTATPPPATPAPANNNNQVVVLPANWAQLSVAEKIRLNPWGCHDTTKIRADNGQCLSGGYTIPGSTPAPTATPPPATPAPANNNNQVVVLPANWAQLSVAEKIRLNPWGCHDTTKIRADNGQCLSGGYTIP